jgi:Family of unknown function (DUF6364)
MEKLTLSVDPGVVARAKQYARAHGTSVSRLVETMLDLATAASDASSRTVAPEAAPPPVLAKLRGALKRGSVRDYRHYLERKYR